MPIKFPQLLQESWNFMRNQRQFTLFALSLLLMSQLLSVLVVGSHTAEPQQPTSPDQISLFGVVPTMLLVCLNLFFNLLFILNIKAINQGKYQSFFKNVSGALVKIFPAIGLHLLMIFPISMGAAFYLSGGGLVALPLLVTGCWVFLKLCLSVYAYVIDDRQGVMDSVKFSWQLTRGKLLPMMLYVIIAYFMPLMISNLFLKLGNNMAVIALSLILSAVISLFVTIFSFRFYQAIRQQG